MKLSVACYGKKLQYLCRVSFHMTRLFLCCCYRNLLFRMNPFLTYIFYFVSLSFLGFGTLKSLQPRTEFSPRNIDLFFTSVSAATVSSMSTVEMEVFSNAQLIVMTILMFIGGEVFTSMVGLHFSTFKMARNWDIDGKVESVEINCSSLRSQHNDTHHDQIELSIVTVQGSGFNPFGRSSNPLFLKYDSIKFLGFVVLVYFLAVQILGVGFVLVYLAHVSGAGNVLRNKGLKTSTFAVFAVVSTFASCGFLPTNENMMVFSKNSGLLLALIPQVLLGNTLFPSALRFTIWVLGKKIKKEEANYLLNNSRDAGYIHLLPSLHSALLPATVLGFILIGFGLFSSLEWNSAALTGLNAYQKVVGIIFQCVNARHTGETIVDISTIAPAILVFFVVMMYLPPYTSFLPIKSDEESAPKSEGAKKTKKIVLENVVFSQLSYLVIFIIIICITERKSLKEDPLNFSVMNIVVEVISAYGNVGFTTGYSCDRQIRRDPKCVTKWYGFSGKWSDEGKIVLILVMFFGRLKKFNMNGGRAWKLL